MLSQKVVPTISKEEQIQLRKALENNFPEETPDELETMFQQLMDAGASHFYQKTVNGVVLYVGVSIDTKNYTKHLLYFMTTAAMQCETLCN